MYSSFWHTCSCWVFAYTFLAYILKGANHSGILYLPEMTEVAAGVARPSDGACWAPELQKQRLCVSRSCLQGCPRQPTLGGPQRGTQLGHSWVDRITLETRSACDSAAAACGLLCAGPPWLSLAPAGALGPPRSHLA